jgi:hypothetical protein
MLDATDGLHLAIFVGLLKQFAKTTIGLRINIKTCA